MARSQQYRQPGDPVRINLNGDVADEVVAEAEALNISYSAYVNLILQGRLVPGRTSQTNVVQLEPVRQELVRQKPVRPLETPVRPLAVLPEPPQTTDGDPEIQSIADFPPT